MYAAEPSGKPYKDVDEKEHCSANRLSLSAAAAAVAMNPHTYEYVYVARMQESGSTSTTYIHSTYRAVRVGSILLLAKALANS